MSKILINKTNTDNNKKYIIPKMPGDCTNCIFVEIDLIHDVFVIERKQNLLKELNIEEWEEAVEGSLFSMLRYFLISDDMRKVYLKHILK